jgi:hypothetical protein
VKFIQLLQKKSTFFFSIIKCRTSYEPTVYKAIQSVISDSEAHTPYHGYNYKNNHVSGGVTTWGRASRRYGLSDCSACLQQVGKLIYSSCGNAVGARYQVSDCFMEYENTSLWESSFVWHHCCAPKFPRPKCLQGIWQRFDFIDYLQLKVDQSLTDLYNAWSTSTNMFWLR